MGEASSNGSEARSRGAFRGRRGFCLGMGSGVARPGNTSITKLLSDRRFVDAVLDFPKNTGVGKIKQGVLLRYAG